MGYSKVIRPKDNFEKFRSSESSFCVSKYIEKQILYSCMSFNSNGEEVKDMDISSFLFNLDKNLDNLIENYKYMENVRLTKMFDSEEGSWKKKGEIVFCGWEYSKDSDEHDIENTKSYVIDRLFVLGTLVKHYDYYNDDELFLKKQNEINDLLEYLKDEVEYSVDFEVIDYYKDCEVGDDDDDENADDAGESE